MSKRGGHGGARRPRATYVYRVRATKQGRLPVAIVKRANKKVVVVSQCDGDVAKLLADLQRDLGTGGTARPAAGAVELQGDRHFVRVCAWLVAKRCVVGLSTQSRESALTSLINGGSSSGGKKRNTAAVPNAARERALAALALLRGGKKGTVAAAAAAAPAAGGVRVRKKARHVTRSSDGTGRKLPGAAEAWRLQCRNARCTWVYCCGECLTKAYNNQAQNGGGGSPQCDDLSDVFWGDMRGEAGADSDDGGSGGGGDGSSTGASAVQPAAGGGGGGRGGGGGVRRPTKRKQAFDAAAVDEALEAMGLLATVTKLARGYARTEMAGAKKKAAQAERAARRVDQQYQSSTRASFAQRRQDMQPGRPRRRQQQTRRARHAWGGSATATTVARKKKKAKPRVRVYDGHEDYLYGDGGSGYGEDGEDGGAADPAAAALAAAAAWNDIARRGRAAAKAAAPASPGARIVPLRRRTPAEIAEAAQRKRLGAGLRTADAQRRYGTSYDLEERRRRQLRRQQDEEEEQAAVTVGTGGGKRLDEMSDDEVFAAAVRFGAVDRHGATVRAVLGGGGGERAFSWRAFLAALPQFGFGARWADGGVDEAAEGDALAAELGASLDRVARGGLGGVAAAASAVHGGGGGVSGDDEDDDGDDGGDDDDGGGGGDGSDDGSSRFDDGGDGSSGAVSDASEPSSDDSSGGDSGGGTGGDVEAQLEDAATALVLMGFEEDAVWEALADAGGLLEPALTALLAADGDDDGDDDGDGCAAAARASGTETGSDDDDDADDADDADYDGGGAAADAADGATATVVSDVASLEAALARLCPGLDGAVTSYLCELVQSMALAGDTPAAAAAAMFALLRDCPGCGVRSQAELQTMIAPMLRQGKQLGSATTQQQQQQQQQQDENKGPAAPHGVRPAPAGEPALGAEAVAAAAAAGQAALARGRGRGRGRAVASTTTPGFIDARTGSGVDRGGGVCGLGSSRGGRGRGGRRRGGRGRGLRGAHNGDRGGSGGGDGGGGSQAEAEAADARALEEAIESMMVLGISRADATLVLAKAKRDSSSTAASVQAVPS